MSSWVKKTTINFNHEGKEYEADVLVFIGSESNYGADADGHRGMYAEFIDELDIKELRIRGTKEAVEVTDALYDVCYDSIEAEDLTPDDDVPDMDDSSDIF